MRTLNSVTSTELNQRKLWWLLIGSVQKDYGVFGPGLKIKTSLYLPDNSAW